MAYVLVQKAKGDGTYFDESFGIDPGLAKAYEEAGTHRIVTDDSSKSSPAKPAKTPTKEKING